MVAFCYETCKFIKHKISKFLTLFHFLSHAFCNKIRGMTNSNEFHWENIAIGAAKYDFIMAKFTKTDVSKDEEFQKRFTGFYRIRRSKELFLKKYYAYMESLKGKTVSFDDIIKKVYTFKGSIEPSFSSKMLATLNPDMPVWDQYVLANAKIDAPRPYNVTIDKCVETYRKVVNFYVNLLKTDTAEEMVRLFDSKLPKYKHFTSIKKIDLMFWQKR